MKTKIFTFLFLALPFLASAQVLTIGGGASNATVTVGDGAKLSVLDADTTSATVGIDIEGNGYLIIQPGGTVVANHVHSRHNEDNTPSQVVIQSDATGDGALIHFNGNITNGQDEPLATVQRYFADGSDNQPAWHFAGIPVQIDSHSGLYGATANDFYINEDNSAWLVEFVEGAASDDDAWSYITDLSTPLPLAGGYSYYAGTGPARLNHTVEFTGDLNSEDVQVGLTVTDNGNDNTTGFNLIGNPYPCAMDLSGLSPEVNNNIENSVWIWNDAISNYVYGSYQPQDPLPPGYGDFDGIFAMGQSLLVRAKQAHTLTIHHERRSGVRGTFYKSSEEIVADDSFFMRLGVRGELGADAVFAGFAENGTNEFENGWDRSKFFGPETSPQLYFVEQEQKLSANHLSTLEEGKTRTLPLYLQIGHTGEYTFNANLAQLEDTKVTLEDLKKGEMHVFSENPEYTFNASDKDASDRFLLHFNYAPTGIEDEIGGAGSQNVDIYAHSNAVYISNKDNASFEKANITIHDMYGRQIYFKQTQLGSMTRIPVQVNNSYLVVRVTKGSATYTEKVFVK